MSRKKKEEGLYDLVRDNVHAVVAVGDNWVQASLIHIDRGGGVIPMRSEWIMLETYGECTPSLRQIKDGIRHCWVELAAHWKEYNKCCLCLPVWATHVQPVARTIDMCGNHEVGAESGREITASDVKRLSRLAGNVDSPPCCVVADMVPHHFVLEGGRCVEDPVEETSTSLSLSATIALSELGIAKGALDAMRDVRARVDFLTTTPAAGVGVLRPDEMTGEVAVIDVGLLYTGVTAFRDGRLCFAARRQGGREDIRAAAARRLNWPIEDVDCYITNRESLLIGKDMDERVAGLALFDYARSPRALFKMDQAARETVVGIAGDISALMRMLASQDIMNVRSFILMGDAPLSLRVLWELIRDEIGLPCRIEIPEDVHTAGRPRMKGFVRTIALIRHCATAFHQPQPYLDHYNQGFFGKGVCHARDMALEWKRRKARVPADSGTHSEASTGSPDGAKPAPVPDAKASSDKKSEKPKQKLPQYAARPKLSSLPFGAFLM